MQVNELKPTDQMCQISNAAARVWTGKTAAGTVVHFYVVAVAVPMHAQDEDVTGLIELFPCDPMITTSEELGIGDTTFRN